jgi:hypothetical protein
MGASKAQSAATAAAGGVSGAGWQPSTPSSPLQLLHLVVNSRSDAGWVFIYTIWHLHGELVFRGAWLAECLLRWAVLRTQSSCLAFDRGNSYRKRATMLLGGVVAQASLRCVGLECCVDLTRNAGR